MKTHKAVFIDTNAFEVREVELETDNLQQIYGHLNCETFDCVVLKNGDGVYIDDEGLLNNPQRFFAIVGQTAILAGNGLIMGTGDEGESVDPKGEYDALGAPVVFFVRGKDGWLHRVASAPAAQMPEPGFTITPM